ncbi:hypothetical protein OG725_37290 (plasmid) [Streptomyces sp. NBC_01213]|uniref:hypothetical protein n=1 Tax=Streptomyces sp. NBC_01213 TaxID=2903776 RepID=UPI00352F04FA|nr:hypothetical protein OG725_36860 [Streptomyces sp. NBC_01213]WSQ82751.1 hypothetical protein OG725_37290 [Streptomyces sp. NBC_01213]
MSETPLGTGSRRRERQTTEPRSHRVPLSFNRAEMDVLRAAAGRESMAPASWAARAALAVAQEILIPVSADRADVLRELIRSRAFLCETATRVSALTPPHPDTESTLAAIRTAVARVDEATLQVMRERRTRL